MFNPSNFLGSLHDMLLTGGEPARAMPPVTDTLKKRAREGDTPSAWRVALAGSKLLSVNDPEHRPHGLARG